MVLVRKYSVLVCLLLLSAVAFAWPSQAGMTVSSCLPQGAMRSTSSMVSTTSTYSTSQSNYGMRSACRSAEVRTISYSSGHFTTSVQELDDSGCAVAPGHAHYKPRPRKLDGENEGNDNGGPMDDPIGDTPWLLFILLAAAYIAHKRYKNLEI